jgi:hypothetical protein
VEVVQTVLGILTPILVLVLGIPIARYTKRLDTQALVDQKIIERRLALYDDVGPKLNDLYCLSRFVGDFRTVDPPEAIAHKRDLDRVLHVNRPVFSPEMLHAYHAFMGTVFETYTGRGEDAKLRIDPMRLQRERGNAWLPEWDRHFSTRGATDGRVVIDAYEALVAAFAADLGSVRRPKASVG